MAHRNMAKWTEAGRKLLATGNRDLTLAEVRQIIDLSKGDIALAIYYASNAGAAIGAKQARDSIKAQ